MFFFSEFSTFQYYKQACELRTGTGEHYTDCLDYVANGKRKDGEAAEQISEGTNWLCGTDVSHRMSVRSVTC